MDREFVACFHSSGLVEDVRRLVLAVVGPNRSVHTLLLVLIVVVLVFVHGLEVLVAKAHATIALGSASMRCTFVIYASHPGIGFPDEGVAKALPICIILSSQTLQRAGRRLPALFFLILGFLDSCVESENIVFNATTPSKRIIGVAIAHLAPLYPTELLRKIFGVAKNSISTLTYLVKIFYFFSYIGAESLLLAEFWSIWAWNMAICEATEPRSFLDSFALSMFYSSFLPDFTTLSCKEFMFTLVRKSDDMFLYLLLITDPRSF